MATDYDEVRPDVTESPNASLQALKSANTSDARSVVREMDETDTVDGVKLPGADLSAEELIIQVIPRHTISSPATPVSWSGTAPKSPDGKTRTPTAATAKAEQPLLPHVGPL